MYGTELDWDGVTDDFYQDEFVQEQINALVDGSDELDVDDEGVPFDADEDYRDLEF